MPFYICEYVGDGTHDVPFRPALFDESAGCSGIDLRPDASRLDGGGLNAALVFCPLDIAGPKWTKLGLSKLENLSTARVQALYSRLKIVARNAGTRIDDLLADLLVSPPAKGWNRLLPNRGFYEIWLGPRTDKLLFRMPVIGGGATDDFNRADETPLASPWVRLTGSTGNLNLASNAVTASATGDKFYYYSAAASSGDHYSQWTNPTRVTGDDWGPAVRIQSGAFSGYWFSVATIFVNIAVFKIVAGSFSTIENLPDFTPANGDIFRCEVSGSTITSLRNGAEVSGSPSTDTSLTGGQPGVFLYDTGGSIDDFDGGNLGGGTVHEVSATDGIFMLDPQSKTEEHTQRDSSLFNDFVSRIEEHVQADHMLFSDTALAQAIRDMIVTDKIFVDDQRVSTIDKTLAEGLFLLDVLTKVEEHILTDFLFLFDSVATETTSSGVLDVLITDGLYMLDEAIKLQEATQRDSLLLGDDRFSELLKLFLDSVLTRADRSSGVDLTQTDKLFISDLMVMVQEKMIPEGLFLSDDVVKTVVQAVTAALVYARLRAQDPLGITIGYADSFLGERTDSLDLLGIMTGWQRPYGD